MNYGLRNFAALAKGYPKAILVRHVQQYRDPTQSPANPPRMLQKVWYTFTKPAARLLSLTSGVSEYALLERTVIVDPDSTTLPWYDPNLGGGGITLGNGSTFTIRFTKNYFETDPTAYDNHGYGNNTAAWLNLASHEVVHINQNIDHGSRISYLFEFAKQYGSSLSHDGAAYEKAADLGRKIYRKFRDYADTKFGAKALVRLLESSADDRYKLDRLDHYWSNFMSDKYPNRLLIRHR